jgi:hypothetical protein
VDAARAAAAKAQLRADDDQLREIVMRDEALTIGKDDETVISIRLIQSL